VKSSWIGHCSPRSDGGVALKVIDRTGQFITFAQGSVITRVMSGDATALDPAAPRATVMPINKASVMFLIFTTVLHQIIPALPLSYVIRTAGTSAQCPD
jgi:hypothetical protein